MTSTITAGHDSAVPLQQRSRLRACEACRHLKVPCKRDSNAPENPCQRCARAKRQCIVTDSKRRRPKPTSNRVAELEKKIDALTASLGSRNPAGSPGNENRNAFAERPSPPESHDYRDIPNRVKPPIALWHNSPPEPSPTWHHVPQGAPGTEPHFFQAFMNGDPYAGELVPNALLPDVIEGQLLDASTAYSIFERYKTEMCHYCPFVVFRPETTGEEIRQTKPLLFLVVLAVACGPIRPDLQPYLTCKVSRILSDRILFRGQRSLEVLQTLQVLMNFYGVRLETIQEMNITQLINVGLVMAYDLGMGKRGSKGGLAPSFPDRQASTLDPDAVETRRAWLACYYNSAGNSISLRRPPAVRWSAYNDECIRILRDSPESLPSDKWLCHLALLTRIAEDVSVQFSMDDPLSVVLLNDPKTQYQLKTFELRLEEWHRDAMAEISDISLIQYNGALISLYIHEIALHHNHNVDDFVPPCCDVPDPEPIARPDFITPAHIDSLAVCLSSIHTALDTFLAIDASKIRTLPSLVFVRLSYAAVALVKMESVISIKGSRFGSVFNVADLKVDYYLNAVLLALLPIREGDRSNLARMFYRIFQRVMGIHSVLTENIRLLSNKSSQEEALPTSDPATGGSSSYTTSQAGTVSESSISEPWRTEPGSDLRVTQEEMEVSKLGSSDFMPGDIDAMLIQMDDPDWFNFGFGSANWPS